MNNDRIQQLLHYIQEQPEEPFNVYALAMEYLKEQPDQALYYLEKLLTNHPNYLPTYYHAAAYYAEAGDWPKAALVYQRGLELASRVGNQKTFDELNRAYRAFQDNEEEWN